MKDRPFGFIRRAANGSAWRAARSGNDEKRRTSLLAVKSDPKTVLQKLIFIYHVT